MSSLVLHKKDWYKKTGKNSYIFMWTSGFHNPLVHTDFNMFVDEC